jgi:hypothetical protein
MRTFIRSIIAGTILASLLVTGVAGTVLAGSDGSRASDGFAIDEEWCFEDVTLTYCFDIEGMVRFISTAPGKSVVNIQEREDVVIYEDDVVVASYRTTTFDQLQMDDDGLFTVQSVGHTRSIDGDLTCVSTVVLRIADYEVVVDRATVPNCH